MFGVITLGIQMFIFGIQLFAVMTFGIPVLGMMTFGIPMFGVMTFRIQMFGVKTVVAKELESYNIDIAGLSETRLPSYDSMVDHGYTLF